MSLKEKIKAANDHRKEIIHCPEWDCDIEVRTMTGKQRAHLYENSTDENGKFIQEKFQTNTLIACCYDPETGEKIFAPEDAGWLAEKASGPIERLARKAMDLSGLTQNAKDQAEKN